MFIFELRGLERLSLSSNNFSGSLQLDMIQQLGNLSKMSLSHNNLLIEYTGHGSSLSSFPQIITLSLASNKLKTFPDFLRNQSKLRDLDLSDNQIIGEIPNWIWKLPNLYTLNLSYNYLVTLDLPLLNISSLSVLDLHSNQLQGQLLAVPPYATYLDFSMNNFSFIIPVDIGNSLTYAYFFSFSSNKLHGSIPGSICSATSLLVLDLSNNFLSGTIPECLIEMSETREVISGMEDLTLGVLNLRSNNLSDVFRSNCALRTLDLNESQLEGKLPKSLTKCKKLEVLDIGNNYIKDTFPCYLKNKIMLRVLVLRSNEFYGPVSCPGPNATWPKLQIIDLASNNFTGRLPTKYFSNWRAMVADVNNAQSELIHHKFEALSGYVYY
jgi:Leucine-rich repeat (LRR) protein